MLPEISLHRPSGLVPKVDVRKRTVVDYQPSWLLLAAPAAALLVARRRRAKSGPARQSVPPSPDAVDVPVTPVVEPGLRRRTVVIAGLRRRRATPLQDPYGSPAPVTPVPETTTL